MTERKKRGKGLTRREFIRITGAAGAGVAVGSLGARTAPAAQVSQKRIVIVAQRRTAGFANHGRSDTEQTGLVDAGLAGQNPVTLERFPWLAEELPSIKKGSWKVEQKNKTMVTVYRLRSGLKWHDGKPHTSQDFKFGWEVHHHPEFPLRDRLVPDLIEKIETPDDRTSSSTGKLSTTRPMPFRSSSYEPGRATSWRMPFARAM